MSGIVATIYDEQGNYVKTLEVPNLKNLQANVPEGHSYVDGDFGEDTYLDAGGAVRSIPPKPSEWHVFDPVQHIWHDPRTPDQIDEITHRHLQALREAATLPKLEFVMRVVFAEILSYESGIMVLDGQVPPELEDMVASMTALDLFLLQSKLKGAVQFDRLDPFILQAADFLQIPPEYVDNIYGINVP